MQARQFYESTASLYDKRHESPSTVHLRKIEESIIKKYSKGAALDIGCGTGAHLNLMKNVIGADVSINMLKIAESRSQRPLIQADAECLPFKDESFDTVTCIFGVLNVCDIRKASKEMSRVLKKDGTAIVSVASEWKKKRSFKERMLEEPVESSTSIRIDGHRLLGYPIGKKLLADTFLENGLRMARFRGFFKVQRYYWNEFRDFTAKEKIKLHLDRVLPQASGRLYFAVFKKI